MQRTSGPLIPTLRASAPPREFFFPSRQIGRRGTDSPYQGFRSGFPAFLIQVAGFHAADERAAHPCQRQSAPVFAGPLADYTFPALRYEAFSTGAAGLAGVLLTFGLAWLFIALALGTFALLPQAKRLATAFGWAAAASYLGFLATLLGTDAL